MAKRIYDGFTFFNELEVLELRLHELHDKVDFFILVEATQTFQGKPKPLVYEANKERFRAFHKQIIHIIVDDMPTSDDPRVREHHQRRAIARGASNLQPEDVLIISDVDEVIKRSTVDVLRANSGYFLIDMPMYQFFLNTEAIPRGWNKVFAFSYDLAGSIPDFSRVRVLQLPTFENFAGRNHMIMDGGWHFTFLGGPEQVREKLASYSHTGGHYESLRRPKAVEQQLMTGHQLGGHSITLIKEIDESYPEYVRNNIDYFVKIGYIKPVMQRVRELEQLFRQSENRRREIASDIKSLLDELKGAQNSQDIATLTDNYMKKTKRLWNVV